jgi:pentatricopeptide repeat protein
MFVLESKLASSPVLGNSVINMYGKCGDIVAAWDVFKSMAEKDKTTWNTMIGACAEHGQGQEALNLTDRMIEEDANPDSETFVNLLSACSHSGRVIHGWGWFASLNEPHYHANSDHCACVIDLFGRAGLLMEAEILMHLFPAQPTIMWFMSMLSACRCQGDSSRGEWAAKHILELDMKSTAPLYMLRSIYYSMADGNMDHVVIALQSRPETDAKRQKTGRKQHMLEAEFEPVENEQP